MPDCEPDESVPVSREGGSKAERPRIQTSVSSKNTPAKPCGATPTTGRDPHTSVARSRPTTSGVGLVEPLPQRIADDGRHGATGRGSDAPDSRRHPQEFQVVRRHVAGRDDLRRSVAAAVRHADRRPSGIGPCDFGHQADDVRDVPQPNRTRPGPSRPLGATASHSPDPPRPEAAGSSFRSRPRTQPRRIRTRRRGRQKKGISLARDPNAFTNLA